jgi:hypothetical protein
MRRLTDRLSENALLIALVAACALVFIVAFVPMWPVWGGTR